MKRQIEFTRGIGNKRTDPRTKKKRIYEKKKQMERCSTIFERVISRVISISFSFARPSYLYNWDMSNRRGNEERSKIEEHGQFANQFSIKLLEFSVCVFVSGNLERGNTSRLGFRLEEEEKETRLINWQIVARYSSRPRRNDSLELRLLSTFRSLCNCVGQDETPSRLYPARLIETGTTLDSLERRVVFQEAGRHRGVGNDRWNVANYWILKDRVRWSWQETRRIYKENRPKVHFVGRL